MPLEGPQDQEFTQINSALEAIDQGTYYIGKCEVQEEAF